MRLVSATCSSGVWKYFALSELDVYFFPPQWTWQNTADFGKYLHGAFRAETTNKIKVAFD